MTSAKEMIKNAADVLDNSFLAELYCQLAQEYKQAFCDFEFLIICESGGNDVDADSRKFFRELFEFKGKHFADFCGYRSRGKYWSKDDFYRDCLAGNFRITDWREDYRNFRTSDDEKVAKKKALRAQSLKAFAEIFDIEHTGSLWGSMQMPDNVLLPVNQDQYFDPNIDISALVVDYDGETCRDNDSFWASPFKGKVAGGGTFYPIHAILKRPAGTKSFYHCTKAIEGFSFTDPRVAEIVNEYIDLDRIPKKLKSNSRSKMLGTFDVE